ncbi:hypothetical protein AF332_11910 [Sporosarcina globispora]|uniref:Uncharacterized protein n=1 Tax=Sporosarcina globispora TaxID=1459 RepID=A0A0M0GCB2_SPOGL|nr:hypothetical protein [Sporosarcina globispora]KON87464.1 hypothetical protein AF332_11910 [Sporosarcina globispora]
MKLKHPVSASIIGGLLITNIVTGYQFSSEYHKQELEIHKKEETINRQQGSIFEKNSLLEKQQGELNTYKETESKLNNQINIKDDEINKLKKQLEETKKREKESP